MALLEWLFESAMGFAGIFGVFFLLLFLAAGIFFVGTFMVLVPGYICVAHGTVGACDRLNTLHFRVPVVGNEGSKFTDRLILMFDPSTTTAVEPVYYLHDGRILEDPVEDLASFYEPIEGALIDRLHEGA